MPAITNINIKEFQEKLLAWFATDGRHFPWRERRLTPYQLIIAEVLLQRTKAETVSKFYPKFIEHFPNWLSLSLATISEIEEYLKPIGLHIQRAKRIKNLAIEMVKHNETLPKDRRELENIPLMGQYIANAVELLVYNKQYPLLDVNMARVLERYFGERKLADIRYDSYLQKLAFNIVNHSKSKELNWAILDFASVICKARKPDCNACFLSNKCTFWKHIRKIE